MVNMHTRVTKNERRVTTLQARVDRAVVRFEQLEKDVAEFHADASALKELLSKLRLQHPEDLARVDVNPRVFSLLFNLPKHLQTTFVALYKLGVANATEVSAITKKARAVESTYLNQLVRGGYAMREQTRQHRIVVFRVNSELLKETTKILEKAEC